MKKKNKLKENEKEKKKERLFYIKNVDRLSDVVCTKHSLFSFRVFRAPGVGVNTY